GPTVRRRNCGPSPRARGSQGAGWIGVDGGRSIPACAGLSTPAPTAVNCTKVHPRVRGALTGVSRLLELCNGPSPRARGSQALVVGQFLGDRSIPACAGLSGQAGSVMFLEPVHPRVRGALTKPSSPSGGEGGPSPRARGSHPGDWPTLDDLRSIPACAGLSPSR